MPFRPCILLNPTPRSWPLRASVWPAASVSARRISLHLGRQQATLRAATVCSGCCLHIRQGPSLNRNRSLSGPTYETVSHAAVVRCAAKLEERFWTGVLPKPRTHLSGVLGHSAGRWPPASRFTPARSLFTGHIGRSRLASGLRCDR